MRRTASDEPQTTLERVENAHRRLDDIGREMGRGAGALRDSAGNVLQMNPSSPFPVFGPQDRDVSVGFPSDSGGRVTSADGTSDRDWSVRSLNASGAANIVGTVNALGASLGASGVFTAGPANVGPIGTTLITCNTTVRTTDVAASHYIDDQLGNVRNGATYSRAGLKTEITPFARRLAGRRCSDIVDALDLVSFRYSDDAVEAGIGVAGLRTGFMLEDLEAAAPDLVHPAGPDNRPHEDDYVGPLTLDENVRAQAPPPQDTYSEHDVRTLILGTLQEKNAEIAELRDTVRALADRLDALG